MSFEIFTMVKIQFDLRNLHYFHNTNLLHTTR